MSVEKGHPDTRAGSHVCARLPARTGACSHHEAPGAPVRPRRRETEEDGGVEPEEDVPPTRAEPPTQVGVASGSLLFLLSQTREESGP